MPMNIPELTPEAQRRHDQANFETVVMMARSIIDDPQSTVEARAEALNALRELFAIDSFLGFR